MRSRRSTSSITTARSSHRNSPSWASMARLVLGLGTSHTPLLAIEPRKWNEYIVRDYTSRRLNMSDGRWLSYQELNQLRNGRYADITDVATFTKKSDICQRALDRL